MTLRHGWLAVRFVVELRFIGGELFLWWRFVVFVGFTSYDGLLRDLV